jgi:hypothetical protein
MLKNCMNNNKFIITEHEGIYVVRDDYFPGGTKARIAIEYFNSTPFDEYVYPGTSKGAAIVALGIAAKETNKKATIFIAERKDYNEIMQEAKDRGGDNLEFKYIKMGFYPKIKSACEKYCGDLMVTNRRCYVLSGLDMPHSTDILSEKVKNIRNEYDKFDFVISACSSGTLQRSLQKADLGNKYIAVATGQSNIQSGIAEVIHHNKKQKFEQLPPKELRPPFPTVLNYDGKCWQYAKEIQKENPDKKILLWNVWAPKSEREKC